MMNKSAKKVLTKIDDSGLDAADNASLRSHLEDVAGSMVDDGSFTVRYSKSIIQSQNGFVDGLESLLTKEGLSMDDFHYMMQKSSNALTDVEKAKMARIRGAMPKPDANTIMQKVIPKSDINNYLSGNYTQIGGYMTRASDAKHLKTYDDIYNGLRLDYEGTAFFIEDGSCGVIRFKSPGTNNAILPTGGEYAKYDYPFTAHGFTAGKNGRLGAPEWHIESRIYPDDGAELWEVFSDGTEELKAIFDGDLQKFVPVN